jgi:hypothetical protein
MVRGSQGLDVTAVLASETILTVASLLAEVEKIRPACRQ